MKKFLCLWFLFSLNIFCQDPEVEKVYINQKTFKIYYEIVQDGQNFVKETQVWCTRDYGNTWELQKNIHFGVDEDGSTYFEFTVSQDGSYGFKTTAIDIYNNREEPPQEGEKPQLIFVVDTEKPVIKIFEPADATSVKAGDNIVVKWEITDENIDETSIAIYYSVDSGLNWFPFATNNAKPIGESPFIVPSTVSNKILFKIFAKDLANNSNHFITEKGLLLTPQGNELKDFLSIKAFLKTRVVDIEYSVKSVNADEIKTVHLWYTKDGGETWKYYGKDTDNKPPIRFEADSDGRYGFYIVVIPHDEWLAPPDPKTGTKPMLDTIIDTIKPVVAITSPRAYDSAKIEDTIKIEWIAKDEFFGEKPISIFVSEDKGKSYKPIFEHISNTGFYEYKVSTLSVGSLTFKVVAEDVVGNISESAMEGFVKISYPKDFNIEITNVKPGENKKDDKKDEVQDTPKNNNGKHPKTIDKDLAKSKEHFEKANKLRAQRKWAEALREYQESIKADPENIMALNDCGYVYIVLKRYEEAEEVLNSAHKISPRDVQIIYNLSISKFGNAKFDECFDLLKTIISMTSSKTQIYKQTCEFLYRLAVQYSSMNKKEKSKEVCKFILKSSEENQEVTKKAIILLDSVK